MDYDPSTISCKRVPPPLNELRAWSEGAEGRAGQSRVYLRDHPGLRTVGPLGSGPKGAEGGRGPRWTIGLRSKGAKGKVRILGMQQWAISRKPKESVTLVGSSETIRGASVELNLGLGIARLDPSQILIMEAQ